MDDGANKPKTPWWQPGMLLFLKLSSRIAAPVIAAVIVGKYLDRKFGTEPWFFLISVGMAFIVSTVMIVIVGMREMGKIEKEAGKNKENEDKNQKSQ